MRRVVWSIVAKVGLAKHRGRRKLGRKKRRKRSAKWRKRKTGRRG